MKEGLNGWDPGQLSKMVSTTEKHLKGKSKEWLVFSDCQVVHC